MRIFISGPITGVENYQRDFEVRAANLRAMGYQVENPVLIGENLMRIFPDKRFTHEEFMKETIRALLNCDGISMLDGWERSEGAKMEYAVAAAIGIPVIKVKVLNPSWYK